MRTNSAQEQNNNNNNHHHHNGLCTHIWIWASVCLFFGRISVKFNSYIRALFHWVQVFKMVAVKIPALCIALSLFFSIPFQAVRFIRSSFAIISHKFRFLPRVECLIICFVWACYYWFSYHGNKQWHQMFSLQSVTCANINLVETVCEVVTIYIVISFNWIVCLNCSLYCHSISSRWDHLPNTVKYSYFLASA